MTIYSGRRSAISGKVNPRKISRSECVVNDEVSPRSPGKEGKRTEGGTGSETEKKKLDEALVFTEFTVLLSEVVIF